MAKPIDDEEILKAQRDQRIEAISAATKKIIQIEQEEKKTADRRKTVYAQLSQHGIAKDEFKEGFKRAKKKTDTLDMFDENASLVETTIRNAWKGTQYDADKEAKAKADAAEDAAEEEADKKKEAALAKAKAETAGKKAGGAKESSPDKPGAPQNPGNAENAGSNVTAISARTAGRGAAKPGFTDKTPSMSSKELNEVNEMLAKTKPVPSSLN